jgi:membrane-bound lytic murein transglycosylase F
LRRRIISTLLLAGSWALLNTCTYDSDYTTKVNIDLKEIKERGKLVAITKFNSIDYFVYNGQPMGFQFELLQRFSEYSGIKIELIASNNLDEITSKLLEGSCDLVAVNIPVTSESSKHLAFTEPLMQSKQVLIQRKPESIINLIDTSYNEQLVKSPLDLAGKTVVVQRNSAYVKRLKNIADEIGKDIDIVEVPEDEEQLIQFVAGGEIEYTVCDERVAQVNQNYYPQIDVNTVLSFSQDLSWAVRKNSKGLLNELNTWLKKYKYTQQYAVLYNKYFQNQWSAQMVLSNYFVLKTGRISAYDEDIKKFSEELQWDWRLLASLIKQESNFLPTAKSWAGAYGLMQILPSTAKQYGVDSIQSPHVNLAVGVKFLKWLDSRFSKIIPNRVERLKFVLAAYNVGIGHVIDAQLLAKKYNKNMYKWDEVKEFLLNKSDPKYYNDPVVKFGYCDGRQPTDYVNSILARYQHYKNIVTID